MERKFVNIAFSNEDEKQDFVGKCETLGFSSITEMIKSSVEFYEKEKDPIISRLYSIHEDANHVITVLQAEDDYGDGLSQDQTQVLNACNLISDVIARLKVMLNNPSNYVDDVNEETGEPEQTYKLALVNSEKLDEIVEVLKTRTFT